MDRDVTQQIHRTTINVSPWCLLGESVDSRIKLADGEGFASDEVIQFVSGCSIKEAISDPSAGLNANGGSFETVLIGGVKCIPLGYFCNEVEGFLDTLIPQIGTGLDFLVVCIAIKPKDVVGVFRGDSH